MRSHTVSRRLVVFLAIGLALSTACLPLPAKAQQPPSDVVVVDLDQLSSKLDELWKTRTLPATSGTPVFSNPAYSPFMPGEWAPSPSTTWTNYAYACGRDPNLYDGLRVAYPWAKIERVPASSTAGIILLSSAVAPFEAQGVRPV